MVQNKHQSIQRMKTPAKSTSNSKQKTVQHKQMNILTGNRVCLFIRCSMEKQDYNRQIFELKNYSKERGYVVTKIIATKISGCKKYDDRPDLQELIQAAKQNLFDKVVVTECSRLGRDVRTLQDTIRTLHDLKKAIVFKNLGGLTSLNDKGDEECVSNIVISIWAELSQAEKNLQSQRIKSKLNQLRASGQILGRPVGTKLDRKTLLKKHSKLAKKRLEERLYIIPVSKNSSGKP